MFRGCEFYIKREYYVRVERKSLEINKDSYFCRLCSIWENKYFFFRKDLREEFFFSKGDRKESIGNIVG